GWADTISLRRFACPLFRRPRSVAGPLLKDMATSAVQAGVQQGPLVAHSFLAPRGEESVAKIDPTPGCMWYWNGEAWSSPPPNATGACTSCGKLQQPPAVNPTEACFVIVDCPGYSGSTKQFSILCPQGWKVKAGNY